MRNMAAIVDCIAEHPDVTKTQAVQFMYVLNKYSFVVMPEAEYHELQKAADQWWNRPRDDGLNREFIK